MARIGPAVGARAVDVLRRVLEAAGWRLDGADEGEGSGLLVSRGSDELAVQFTDLAKGSGAARLLPAWSQAWLRVQASAPPGREPVAIVMADRVGARAADELMQFIAEVAPLASAGVIDRSGMRRFRGPLLDNLNAAGHRARRGEPRAHRLPINLFSDLNQWMLKVLLAPDLPEEMLRAPRGRYRGPTDLARAAKVSAMSASRLIRELREQGYLDERARVLGLVRRANLLQRWQAAVAAQPVVETGWRGLLRASPVGLLDQWFAEHEGCLGLFAAAKAYKLGFVEGVPPHIYEAPPYVRQAEPEAGWMRTTGRDVPDLFVRIPNSPESMFRGMVDVGGRPVADIVQVWLEVGSHPTRGREQADLIWRKVLGPMRERAPQ